MEIQKNDIMGFVRNVEKQLNEKKASAKKDSSSAIKTSENANNQRLNKVMSGTLKIQEEIRSLQTEYSRHQSALAFVKNSQGDTWQNELKKFLNSSFRYNPDILPETREQFLQDSGGALAQLKNEILKKEVVMQNIISASPLSKDDGQETMNKVLQDSDSLRELVVALRTGSVKKLTQE